MGSGHKFHVFAAMLVLAVGAFVLTPGTASAAQSTAKAAAQAAASWHAAIPGHAPICAEHRFSCAPGALAAQPVQSPVYAAAAAGFVRIAAGAPLRVRAADLPPAAPFSILFRNFRE